MKEKRVIQETVCVGRRKTAVASIRLRKGTGKIDINHIEFEKYFFTDFLRKVALSPLHKLGMDGQYDLIIRVNGGGIDGQAQAVRLAISRAIISENEKYRSQLKEWGYLTRDPRKREREKYGRPGARKRFQFSKR